MGSKDASWSHQIVGGFNALSVAHRTHRCCSIPYLSVASRRAIQTRPSSHRSTTSYEIAELQIGARVICTSAEISGLQTGVRVACFFL